jgi:hypothetical protein
LLRRACRQEWLISNPFRVWHGPCSVVIRIRTILVGRLKMTNIQSIMGAAVWMMIAISLAFEALRPVVIA